MSRRAIDRAGWSDDERSEYDALLEEVVSATTDSAERLDLFEERIDDAIQAHRPWASEVDSACRRFGMGKEIARYEARNRVLVSWEGRVLSLPAIQARKVKTDSGQVTYQRELIELWSWPQIVEKRSEALRSANAYTEKVAHYDRLLALQVLAPESDSPRAAAEQLGLDLDEFLSKAA
jgi:hypothetical protein